MSERRVYGPPEIWATFGNNAFQQIVKQPWFEKLRAGFDCREEIAELNRTLASPIRLYSPPDRTFSWWQMVIAFDADPDGVAVKRARHRDA